MACRRGIIRDEDEGVYEDAGVSPPPTSTDNARGCLDPRLIQAERQPMHIISRKALREFWERYPDSESPLRRWYTIFRRTDYKNFNELRETFPSADWVKGLIVFNIGGNKYRLIAAFHFNRGKIYVRHVLTHEDYDQGGWRP